VIVQTLTARTPGVITLFAIIRCIIIDACASVTRYSNNYLHEVFFKETTEAVCCLLGQVAHFEETLKPR
jgi:hypothetical protein